jgi:hypothetical protein
VDAPPDSPLAAPAGAASADTSATEQALRAEVARLRDRLRFYEGFDRIIQDNISRSSELLRAAEEERSAAARDVAAARDAAAREAERQRSLLVALAGEAQAWSRLLLEAIEGGVCSAAPSDASESAVRTNAPESAEPEPSADDAAATMRSDGAAAALSAAPAVAPPMAEATARATPGAMTVIVHGLPDAHSALSLQRHLARVAGGGTVLAREFMDGVARFEVSGNSVTFDDLRRWDGGEALRPIHLQADVVEAAAPGALPD